MPEQHCCTMRAVVMAMGLTESITNTRFAKEWLTTKSGRITSTLIICISRQCFRSRFYRTFRNQEYQKHSSLGDMRTMVPCELSSIQCSFYWAGSIAHIVRQLVLYVTCVATHFVMNVTTRSSRYMQRLLLQQSSFFPWVFLVLMLRFKHGRSNV